MTEIEDQYEDGPLVNPYFGTMPPEGPKRSNIFQEEFRYASLLRKVRDHPGRPACIAVFETGSRRDTNKQIDYSLVAISHWLRKYFPLEDWKVSRRTIGDVWNRREIWVTFNKVLTVEEAADRDEARAKRAAALAERGWHNKQTRVVNGKLVGIRQRKEIMEFRRERGTAG